MFRFSVFVCLFVFSFQFNCFAKSHHIQWMKIQAESVEESDELGWEDFRKNLLEFGILEEDVQETIEDIKSRPENFEEILDSILQKSEGSHLTLSDYKKLSSSQYPLSMIYQLGYWANLPGFNAPLFVKTWLASQEGIEEEYLECLIGWSRYWIDSPHAVSIAEKLWFKSEAVTMGRWLLRHLKEADRVKLGKIIKDTKYQIEDEAGDLLSILSSTPLKHISKDIQQRILKNWYFPKKFPPIILDQVCPLLHGSHAAGNCPHMSGGHFKTLGIFSHEEAEADDVENEGNTVLIAVKGQIVGALKLIGDQSMVALRNVNNSKGEVMLTLGGVYFLSRELVAQIQTLPRPKRGWAGINLEELHVKPSTFLMNEYAWQQTNLGNFLYAVKGQMNKQDVKSLTSLLEKNPRENVFKWHQDELREKTMPLVYKALDCARLLFEKKDS